MGLKNVPAVISPNLLHALASMGHGDEIVLADIHFPTSSLCRNGPLEVRADGITIPVLLEGILRLLPLDTYVLCPAAVMQLVESDKNDKEPPVWATYQKLLDSAENRTIEIERVERFQFYERAKRAFAIVHTGETAKYGNLILKKGLVAY